MRHRIRHHKTGRTRVGSLEPAGTHPDGSPRFRFRLRLTDGTRSERFDVPHGKNAKEARAFVARMQSDEDDRQALHRAKQDAARVAAAAAGRASPEETWSAWFDRYLPTKECGEGHRLITSRVAAKWVTPLLGPKAMRSLTRDDLEDVRDKLDRAIDAKEIRHTTARNAWGVVTGAMKAASAARDRSLRVLDAPIHLGILPPKRGASRQRPWLYPSEWAAFVHCDDVPAVFRRVCALALYTGLRPGELRALTWGDVDLRARTISVSKAVDPFDGSVKPPKTAHGQRVIPIHENLVPMLEGLKAKPDALVLGDYGGSEDHMATSFRKYLEKACVRRPRLSADNATEERIDFRSLRDSHATWLALAGVSSQVIQRRMGHASPTTTDRYVKVAETFAAENVGAPFPVLPVSLWPSLWPKTGKTERIYREKAVARVGFEPTTFGL